MAYSYCYLGIYAGLGGVQALLTVLGTALLVLAAILASYNLHINLLKRTLRFPLSFFDTTSIKRVLSHFSRDIVVIDVVIPRLIHSFLFTFLTVFSALVVIVVVTPIIAIVLLPLVVLIFIISVRKFVLFVYYSYSL